MERQTDLRVQLSAEEEERPVIIRACDMCRKKKIRCEPTAQGCGPCTKYGTRCHFTPIATKRKPRRPAGFRYIAQLEQRLLGVETLLGDRPLADLSTLGGYGTNRLWPHPAPELRPASLPARQPLPTKAFAQKLIEDMFSNYNKFLPLFNEEDFLREFHLKYESSSPRDAGWWACLNVVLSIAHRLRSIRAADPTQDHNLAYGYVQNAFSVISELNVSDRSLSAVQALAGMACILQGTPDPAPAAMLVAAALRLAQAMNLHRECSSPGLTEAEAEKRRRVFWKVYILDKDISLRTGRPFGQDDDEMDAFSTVG
ncbi:hypothetical protein A9Z42_0041830 [Trichoderma parareesei]|uniref:Zn(2)-C6 fungal-type domain-containing protein n=1 Tax=Trichoderma parareesei TaxID=858221 RepID=A0A2H2ZCL1_TRIPA|nr:hypothetical protein A9Z42_0041830 [Trichoderma parareesei]